MSAALAISLADDVFRNAGNLVKGKGLLSSFNAGRHGSHLGAKLMNQADDLKNLTTLYRHAPDVGISIPSVSDDFIDLVKAEKIAKQKALIDEVINRGGSNTAAMIGKKVGQLQNLTGLKMHDSFGEFMHSPVGMIAPEMILWTAMDAASKALMNDVVPVNQIPQLQSQQLY